MKIEMLNRIFQPFCNYTQNHASFTEWLFLIMHAAFNFELGINMHCALKLLTNSKCEIVTDYGSVLNLHFDIKFKQ